MPDRVFVFGAAVDTSRYTGAHALALLHPEQSRILTVRENMRLQVGHAEGGGREDAYVSASV